MTRIMLSLAVNGERLGTALLTSPASDMRASGVNGNAINVADNTAGSRFQTEHGSRHQRKIRWDGGERREES